jgi:uncharacterized protein YjiS (DUF1127 family)
MTARFAKDQMSFVMPSSFSPAQTVTAFRRPAGLPARFAAMVQWLAELPRRRAVIEELSALSDHELADIGLTRDEVGRVFDETFAAERGAH